MSGGVRWTPGGGNILPAFIPPEPLSASTVWGTTAREGFEQTFEPVGKVSETVGNDQKP